MEIIILIVIAFIFVGVMIAYFIWGIFSAIVLHIEYKQLKKFEAEFRSAVINSQPTWEEIHEIARIRSINRSDVLDICHKTMRAIMVGSDKDLSSHKDLIRSYIEKHNEVEPFEGIPTDIRIHLERLSEKIGSQRDLLEPLTNQIKDLLSVNQKERRYQKYYTMGGFVIGLLGLGFAIYVYFWSPTKSAIPCEPPQVVNPDNANKSLQQTP